jgi:acetyl esterase/lipase
MEKITFVYKEVNGCEIKGDFYPIAQKQAPLVVYLHGGGLIWGSREDLKKEQIACYQQAGFHVCSLDYRLAPESKLPAIKEDIEDALVWLKEIGAERFGFDPEQIAVIGSSAGGYLALLAGTLQVGVRPKAIVSFYGYGDITGDWYRKPSPYFSRMTQVPEVLVRQMIQAKTLSEAPIEKRYAIYLYCRQQGKWTDYVTAQASLDEFCPVRQVDADFPPTMLIHGDIDEDVPYEQSVMIAKALASAGVHHQLLTIANGKHSFDQNINEPTVQKTYQQVTQYLQQTL